MMAGKYIRREAKDVLDLPPILRKDVWMDFEEEGKELEEAYKAYLEGRAGNKITSAKTHSAYIKGQFTGRYVKDLLEGGVGSIVIFSDHIDSLKEAYKVLAYNITHSTGKVNTSKWNCTMITGSVSVDKRQQAVDDFQSGKLNVILATIGSMSVGWTLTRANNVVFNDLSWVPADNAQAEKRVHRIGQDSRCVIHRIIGSEIDLMIVETITKKMEALHKVLNEEQGL